MLVKIVGVALVSLPIVLPSPAIHNYRVRGSVDPPFPFPTHHPSTSTSPDSSETPVFLREGAGLVSISVEVRGGEDAMMMLVRAASISWAEGLARSRFPGSAVRVVFPIDGDDFFAGDGASEGIEHSLPETLAG